MKIDVSKITNIEFSDIDWRDYPDFCDAYISSAFYKGREMTEGELEYLDEHHRDFVYDELNKYLF